MMSQDIISITLYLSKQDTKTSPHSKGKNHILPLVPAALVDVMSSLNIHKEKEMPVALFGTISSG
jgi:hypothetical protein